MCMITDDPLADYARWETEQAKELERLPICCECGQPITDDYLYEINGECICESCMEQNFKKSTDDYID